jgi:hypothetical protein
MECCVYGTCSHIHNTSFSSLLTNGVFGTCKPFQLSVMKQSSLFGRFVSYEENGALCIWYLESHSQHFIFFVTYKWAQ